jgi:hypothetical protein
MNPVERIARTICREALGTDEAWQKFVGPARAALKAMRPNTPVSAEQAMWEAGLGPIESVVES